MRKVVVTTAVVLALLALAAPAGAEPGSNNGRGVKPTANPVADQYIVTLNTPPGASAAAAASLTAKHGGQVERVYSSALNGYAAHMNANQAAAVANDPNVSSVEQDGYVSIDATQSPAPSWGLDRIDQRDRPLDNAYTPPNAGTNVTAYIIDTGIYVSHSDFGGRASVGTDTVGDQAVGAPGYGIDCNGHGTHVAGTVGGTTYGVAKSVSLVAVRVLSCAGSGSWAGVISGIDWVTAHHAANAVANMSLGGGFSSSVNTAVANSVASGVTYAIAAGNSNADACNYSPASTPTAITVGATQSDDLRASYSNYGTCVDLFAPGTGITSDWNNGGTNTISGTSMATPHVTGSAALYLSAHPGSSPAQVTTGLLTAATVGDVTSPGTGSPNLLDYVGTGSGGGGGGTLPPATAPGAPALNGSSAKKMVKLTWTVPSNGGSAITSYRVYKSTTGPTGSFSLRTTTTGTSFNDNGLRTASSYSYYVVAVNSVGEGAPSNTVTVRAG
jgi:subtilisin family serine protease